MGLGHHECVYNCGATECGARMVVTTTDQKKRFVAVFEDGKMKVITMKANAIELIKSQPFFYGN